jgi:hypothetical protein
VKISLRWLEPGRARLEAYRDWSSTYLERYLDYRAEDAALRELGR